MSPSIPLKALRAFLLDMDGTLYLGEAPIPGAPAFIRYLRGSGRRILFFTNNPTRDPLAYCRKLAGMGISATPEEVLTSGAATIEYLLRETSHRSLYLLGTPPLERQFEQAGFRLTRENPDAVVLAFDKTLTYEKLEGACLHLRGGAPYFATNPDRVCPTDYGYIPDCGAMAALIEAATGRVPQFIGKPDARMARMGMARLDAAPGHTAMVGDRLYTDMEMARRAGAVSILVLSGEATREEAEALESPPDYVFGSVAQLQQALEAADTLDA